MVTSIRRYFELICTSGILAQMVRYGIAGILTTLIYSSLYLSLVWSIFPGDQAVVAVPFAFMPALIAGFLLHSHWSFAGHGSRENSGRQQSKFLIVHSAGFALNLGFTWVLTAWLGAPEWVPLLPTVTVTPVASFLLQRQWVFA